MAWPDIQVVSQRVPPADCLYLLLSTPQLRSRIGSPDLKGMNAKLPRGGVPGLLGTCARCWRIGSETSKTHWHATEEAQGGQGGMIDRQTCTEPNMADLRGVAK